MLRPPFAPEADSEREPRSELHLERDRDRRGRAETTEVPGRLAVIGGELEVRVLVADVRTIEDVVELGEHRDLLVRWQIDVLGQARVEIDERLPARVVDAARDLPGAEPDIGGAPGSTTMLTRRRSRGAHERIGPY